MTNPTADFGECFSYATHEANQNGGVVVHAVVTEPLAREPKSYAHAWVERDGLVFDNMGAIMGRRLSIEDFHHLFKPKKVQRYSAEDAFLNAIRIGHHGPWTKKELARPRRRTSMSRQPEYVWETDCRSSDYESISNMNATAEDITLVVFKREVGARAFHRLAEDLGYDKEFPISGDWHVGYYRSTYRGVPCVFLRWSGIEHIFVKSGGD